MIYIIIIFRSKPYIQFFTIYYNKIKILMKELSAHQFKKILNSDLLFEIQKYNQALNPNQYLTDLINYVFIKQRINPNKICLNQLSNAIKQLGFDLTIQQLHELFIYSTFESKSRKKITNKQKLMCLVSQQRKKIKIESVVEWLKNNLLQIQLKKTSRISKTADFRSRYENSSIQKVIHFKLPVVTKSKHTKIESELRPLIEIFDEMQKLRQNSGLIPINFDSNQNNLVEVPFVHIPYDPELYQLNQNLSRLRIKAQIQLKRIIQLAKQQPEIKKKLEAAIQKFQISRIEANQKIGRNGAINAQKRLVLQRQKQMNKHKGLKLDYDEDLIRAARVYNLLSVQEPKIKPVY